jgi:hypothetical protein
MHLTGALRCLNLSWAPGAEMDAFFGWFGRRLKMSSA